MKTLLVSLLLLCSVPLLANDQVIVPGDSAAFHNTMQIHELFLNSNRLQEAAYLATIIEKKRLSWMTLNNYWGNKREEDGKTFLGGEVEIREDLVILNRKLDMMNMQDARDFSTGSAYANVMIHELFHLHDFQSSPLSSENETYHRSFLVYRDILLNYLLKNFEIHSSIGSPEAKIWGERVRFYASQIHSELSSYSLDKYGETPGIPRLFTHDGCVKPELSREEFAFYALQLSMIFRETETYENNFAKFDKWARFQYPVQGNPRCMEFGQTIPPMPEGLPVGYNGPRMRQRIFEVTRVEKGNLLRIAKTNEETLKANIDIFVDREDPTQEPDLLPRTMIRIGNVWQWYKSADIHFKNDESRFLVTVAERAEGGLPQNLSLTMKRRWQDDNGNWLEGPVSFREITPAEQTRYGFYPVAEKLPFAQFSKSAPALRTDFRTQVYGLKVVAKKGDHLRMKAPQIDGREVQIHRLLPDNASEPFRATEQVAIMWDWYNSLDYKFDADGIYYLLITRDTNLKSNLAIQFSFQLSRSGRSGPSGINFVELTKEELGAIGCHTPAEIDLSVSVDGQKDSLGLGVSWGTFRPFALYDLNAKKGDWLHFVGLLNNGDTATTHLVREKSDKQIEIVQSFYNWYATGDYSITTDDRYFLAIVRDQDFIGTETGTVYVNHYRGNREGPKNVQYKRLSIEEVSAYGFFPRGRFQFETAALTTAHPKGFVHANHHYQLYRFIISQKTRLRLNKAKDGVAERRFVLSKVEKDLWEQGKASLRDVLRTFSWEKTRELDVEEGWYVLAVEGDRAGPTPWELEATTLDFDPRTIKGQTLTLDQMKDPRYRLFAQ